MSAADGGRILVVDDVPENVRLLDAMLAPRGYDVVSAAEGLAALWLAGSCSSPRGRVTVAAWKARRPPMNGPTPSGSKGGAMRS